MNPLNQPERRTRLWQFALLYLLALAVPLGASYYLFSNNSLADENARLKKELDRTHQEQKQLVARFDTLTHHLQRIDMVDQRLRDEKNDLVMGRLTTSNQDYLNDIAVGLSQLRLDSAQLQVPAHRQLVRDELRAFDLFRSNRSTIDVLRGQLAKSGADAQGSARLAEELAQTKQQLIICQASLSHIPQAPSGGTGASVAPSVAPPPSAALKLQVSLLQDQVAFANADCLRQRALDHKARSKERKQLLQESRTAFIKILQAPATEDLKQSIEKTLEPINVELGKEPRFFGLF
ncbi:hypothetical protein FNT36_14900 [Hymenobacter setariae]|uniref:Uncharacterized protein n=1 Tax=Hymenobacter setariae TaxID=2594794 RepID=A0A558BR29_9BACT|nr:hypothetical protein [Hymenobacter setariae]TVT38958.1 hypothetical protein FNT36_14900 [Hymenobacter setariae]